MEVLLVDGELDGHHRLITILKELANLGVGWLVEGVGDIRSSPAPSRVTLGGEVLGSPGAGIFWMGCQVTHAEVIVSFEGLSDLS